MLCFNLLKFDAIHQRSPKCKSLSLLVILPPAQGNANPLRSSSSEKVLQCLGQPLEFHFSQLQEDEVGMVLVTEIRQIRK